MVLGHIWEDSYLESSQSYRSQTFSNKSCLKYSNEFSQNSNSSESSDKYYENTLAEPSHKSYD